MNLCVIIIIQWKVVCEDSEECSAEHYIVYFNPLNAKLNPICKSQLAELFCGVFKFYL
jgi:hypothetical protein